MSCEAIYQSSKRLEAEKIIIESSMSETEMSMKITELIGSAVDVNDIREYRKKYIQSGKSFISDITTITDKMSEVEVPPVTDLDLMASYFSFKKINEDFKLIYDRVERLNVLAASAPDDETYDRRIIAYLGKADELRRTVTKNFFHELKKGVMLSVGKKIVIAAFGIFMPYIPVKYRGEAKKRFMAAIENLVNSDLAPEEPQSIKDIRDARPSKEGTANGSTTEEKNNKSDNRQD